MDKNVDSLVEALKDTRVSPGGVSFASKSLKLDTEEDAKEVIEEINRCKDLQYLNLEGNTLGVEASKGISKALEKHPEFKRALWKDMFTGRMKTEIPKALQFLGDGLVTAKARLTELDLSDNAFGPIGVEGLAALLRSSSCYALEELRLNNNGLGITGGKLLASALTDCYNCSKKEGKPLALKVFIAGRNRLENDGAKALSSVFKMIGTLEEVSMPQNGIYHVGISALSEAFTHNKNLRILNLNDNTIGQKGALAFSNALPQLQNLEELNFGDCLLKTEGALLIAGGLKDSHEKLEELVLGFNEIKKKGGLRLVEAMSNKTKLKSLVLDGNQFGESGRGELRNKLKEIGKLNVLGSLEDDESEEESENGSDAESEPESNNEDSDEVVEVETLPQTNITVGEFMKTPSVQNFLGLGSKRDQVILDEAKKNNEVHIDTFIPVLLKVAGLTNSPNTVAAQAALKCAENLFKELFCWAQDKENLSIVNNSLLVSLGLIKSEDKQFKPQYNVEGCLNALKSIVKLNFVPESTRDTLKVFMQREVDKNGELLNVKRELLTCLK